MFLDHWWQRKKVKFNFRKRLAYLKTNPTQKTQKLFQQSSLSSWSTQYI